MGPYSFMLIAISGIAFFICILQLFMGIRKKLDMHFIIGAFSSLVLFAYAFEVSLLFIRPEVKDDIMISLRVDLLILQVLLISYIWLIQILLQGKMMLEGFIGVICLLFLVIISLLLSEKTLFGTDGGLSFTLPEARDRFYIIGQGFTVWRLMINLSILISIVSILIIVLRNTERFSIRFLMLISLGAGIIFLTGIIDQMVDLGLVRFYYVLPFGLIIFYLILTILPVNQIIKDVIKRRDLIDLEEKWRILVNQASVIIVVLNRMGNVDYINPYFIKISGYSEDEVVGKDWFEFFVPSDQHYDVQSAFIEILEYDFHAHYRNPILTKNQEKRQIDWYNVRLRGSNDQVVGSISIGMDITEDQMECEKLKIKLKEAETLIENLKRQNLTH
jgi:PAS domain S-box-containing protein